MRLHDDRPADLWTDALPLGNGRLGAMCFGGVRRDRFQVNDDTCWSGSPATASGRPLLAPGEGPEVVRAARKALADGDVRRAERLVQRLQHGHTQAYQPLVDLVVEQPGRAEDEVPPGYRRWLDLGEAVAGHRFGEVGERTEQEAFVSAPAGVLVVHRTSEAPLDLLVRVTSPHPVQLAPGDVDLWAGTVRMPSHVYPPHEDAAAPVVYDDSPGASITVAVVMRVVTDGALRVRDDGLTVHGAREVTVLLTSVSDYAGAMRPPHGDVGKLLRRARGTVAAAAEQPVERLRADHVADHAALFDRVALDLGGNPGHDALTTDSRVARHAVMGGDPALAALLFQYGRYLMIAGSRPGTMPLTLQGIWNEDLRPAWSSAYTTNINLEMAYWPAGPANLAECAEPLLGWLPGVAASGAATARELYGARGWTAHHNSDAWAFTLPAGEGDGDPSWTAWPLGGAWLAQHVWDHFEFTGDTAALGRAWPLLHGAARFCLDWLVEQPDGSLGTSPATSPENHFVADDGAPAAVSTSTTSDLALVRGVLERTLASLDALEDCVEHVDPDTDQPVDVAAWRAEVDAALRRLPGERALPDGRLAEWSQDLADAEPEHRHTSHLIGVFPGGWVHPDTTPELAKAAAATLDARGPRSTGWALAWRLALRARLHDGAGAEELVHALLAPAGAGAGVYRNLFSAHPPFQVDGNLGFTAGVVELLVQGHRVLDGVREVHLLPALPPGWREGSARGLRVRGGITVDVTWAEGELVEATLTADAEPAPREGDELFEPDDRADELDVAPVVVRCGSQRASLGLRPGEPAVVTPATLGDILAVR